MEVSTNQGVAHAFTFVYTAIRFQHAPPHQTTPAWQLHRLIKTPQHSIFHTCQCCPLSGAPGPAIPAGCTARVCGTQTLQQQSFSRICMTVVDFSGLHRLPCSCARGTEGVAATFGAHLQSLSSACHAQTVMPFSLRSGLATVSTPTDHEEAEYERIHQQPQRQVLGAVVAPVDCGRGHGECTRNGIQR